MTAFQWLLIVLFILFTIRWFFFPLNRSVLIKKILLLSPKGKQKFFSDIDKILTASSGYFRSLSPQAKKIFLIRCVDFNRTIRYLGMEGLTVTEEMKWRIAATAVQITFGFRNFSLSHYHTIKVFPETFYSKMHNRYLKGGASTSGTLYFSWTDFVAGFDDPSDRYNLGLHEMAHALRLQLLHGTDFDQKFANYSDHWEDIARPEFESMSHKESSFLRSYAAVNMEEFFAICVEHFFEVPSEFKKQLPDIYNHLCYLLNQDPERSRYDYKLSDDFVERVNSNTSLKPIPLHVSKSYKYDNWNWSFNVILVGFFVAFPVILFLYGKVLFKPLHIIYILGISAAVLSQFHNYFVVKGIFLFRHLMLFATMGCGMILSVLILLLNLNITRGIETETYKISDFEFLPNRNKGNLYRVNFQENQLKSYPDLRTFTSLASKETNQLADSIKFTFSIGIIGWKNVLSKELVFKQNQVAPVPY